MQTQVTFHCFNSGDERGRPVRKISGTPEEFEANLTEVLACEDIDKFYCSYTQGVKIGAVFLPLHQTVRDTAVFIAKTGDKEPVETIVTRGGTDYSIKTVVHTRMDNMPHFDETKNFILDADKNIVMSPQIAFDTLKEENPDMAFAVAFALGMPPIMSTRQERKFEGFFERQLAL